MIHRLRTSCRICGSADVTPFLSLGPTPLANAFLRSPGEFGAERRYPLDLYFCSVCSLVQLMDVIDPAVLFKEYIYVTGTSDTMAAHNTEYARTAVDLLGLGADDLVVEAASNDGSLLSRFRAHGVRTLGVEPAANIAAKARAAGVPTLEAFFNRATAAAIRAEYGAAKAVIGNNVLAHVDDTRDFLAGCADLLAPGGLVMIEVPYLAEFIDRLEYDTVYHEHLCYFSVSALKRLADEVGLSIVRMDRVPVHGGSLRMYACARRPGGHAAAVEAWAQEEARAGLTGLPRYLQFAADVTRSREALRDRLGELIAAGNAVAGYGAPAKGNTLLNYCGIGTEWLSFTVDKNPMKVGTYTPGMHIPVLEVSTLLDRQPDYVLILAWNFAEEIMRQQAEFRNRGGRFLLPVNEPRAVARS
jgi:SAM-dependent methyltransferase